METIPIVYEDNHLMAVNKPARMLSQGDRTGDDSVEDRLKLFIKERDRKPGNVYLKTVHRLDRPVSGILLLSKTSKALPRMMNLFKEREVEKTYMAVTDGIPDFDVTVVESYLKKDTKKNVVSSFAKPREGAKRAITDLRFVGRADNVHLIEIKPKTGRAHQIRKHMADRELPILGDAKYGSKFKGGGVIHLHAYSLSFIHPVRKERIFIKALPPKKGRWTQFFDLLD